MSTARASRDLTGQVVALSGASGDIGRSIAAEFARRGAAIACLDHRDNAPALASVRAQGGTALGVLADLSDDGETREAFEEILAWRGRVDVLVNNAGATGTARAPFWEIETDLWDSVVDVNTVSVLLCSSLVVPVMREQGSGRIVNVSSSTAAFGMANYLQYLASKTAIVGMTQAMARELGPLGIAVNAVAPGLVYTPRTATTMTPQYRDKVAKGQCLQTSVELIDIAHAVAFLGGSESRMITGQTLLVAGGASMGRF